MAGKRQAQLVVLEHPVGEFYKDEGGKSNFLVMTVTVPPGYPLLGSIPLKASLFFESERRVEEKDQSILNLMGREYSGFEITPEAPTATFEFRLEKVSRRKDGQRFKLFVEPKFEDETPKARPPLIGVFSRPICVMSKRKTGERLAAAAVATVRPKMESVAVAPSVPLPSPAAISPPPPPGSGAGAAAEIVKMFKSLHAQMQSISHQLSQVHELMVHQDRRMNSLENRLAAKIDEMPQFLFADNALSLDFDQFNATPFLGFPAPAQSSAPGAGSSDDLPALTAAAAVTTTTTTAPSLPAVPSLGVAAAGGAAPTVTTTVPPSAPGMAMSAGAQANRSRSIRLVSRTQLQGMVASQAAAAAAQVVAAAGSSDVAAASAAVALNGMAAPGDASIRPPAPLRVTRSGSGVVVAGPGGDSGGSSAARGGIPVPPPKVSVNKRGRSAEVLVEWGLPSQLDSPRPEGTKRANNASAPTPIVRDGPEFDALHLLLSQVPDDHVTPLGK